jgi:hypothetical protein
MFVYLYSRNSVIIAFGIGFMTVQQWKIEIKSWDNHIQPRGELELK